MPPVNKISGVDVYDIKNLSGVEVTSDWEVVKEFDFTKAPDHTFADGVAQSFGGVDWTCRNLSTYGGADSSIKFIEGSGLVMDITGSSAAHSLFYWRTQTSPLLQATVASIDPNYDDENTICFQVLLSSSFSNLVESSPYSNWPLSQFIISDGDYGTDQDAIWVKVRASLSGSATPGTAFWDTRCGGSTVVAAASDVTDQIIAGSGATRWPRCMEIVAVPASGYVMSAAHTSSTGEVIDDFPKPISMTTLRSSATMEWQIQNGITNNPGVSPSWPLKASNMVINLATGILLWCGPDCTVGPMQCGITTTFTKLRILRRVPNG